MSSNNVIRPNRPTIFIIKKLLLYKLTINPFFISIISFLAVKKKPLKWILINCQVLRVTCKYWMFHSSSPKPLFSQSNRTNSRDGCQVREKNRPVTDIETSFWFISAYKLIWYSFLTTYAVLCKEMSHPSFLHVLPPRSQTLMSFFKEH